jgi:hypothetical protein
MIRTPGLALLVLLAAPASAQDLRGIEVSEFTHRIDFANQPVRNRFVIVKKGRLVRHPVPARSSARGHLRELHVRSDPSSWSRPRRRGSSVAARRPSSSNPSIWRHHPSTICARSNER